MARHDDEISSSTLQLASSVAPHHRHLLGDFCGIRVSKNVRPRSLWHRPVRSSHSGALLEQSAICLFRGRQVGRSVIYCRPGSCGDPGRRAETTRIKLTHYHCSGVGSHFELGASLPPSLSPRPPLPDFLAPPPTSAQHAGSCAPFRRPAFLSVLARATVW